MGKINDYIQSIPDHRLGRFLSIHDLILKTYPDASVDMSYKMPTYRVGNGWVALANQKTIFRFILVVHHTWKHTDKNIRSSKPEKAVLLQGRR
jgi:hypothetical protein